MSLTNLNILLADDDADDCLFFETALTKLSLSAKLNIVNDGEQLMESLAETAILPDVIFLDINMPRKNGTECLNEIKKDARLKNIPVVIFSTSQSREMMSSLFKTGAHIYVRKPGDFDQLKEVIHQALPLAVAKIDPNSQLKYILNA